MLHPRARFEAAVSTLVADGPVKRRLQYAFETYLAELQHSDLPKAVRETFSELTQALQRVAPIGAQSKIGATINKMSPIEASRHAETILGIYVSLISKGERAEPLKVVNTGKNGTPRFLSNGGS